MAELSVVQNNNELPDFPVSFDTFWLLYPRHIAKKYARQCFERLSSAQQMDAIAGIAAWRPHYLKKDPEYLPHPSSWLNGERWEDELPRSPTVSAGSHVPFAGSPHEPVARGALPAHVLEVLRKLTGRKA